MRAHVFGDRSAPLTRGTIREEPHTRAQAVGARPRVHVDGVGGDEKNDSAEDNDSMAEARANELVLVKSALRVRVQALRVLAYVGWPVYVFRVTVVCRSLCAL